MIWIYIVLGGVSVAETRQFTDYYKEPLFDDKLCLSSAVQLTGVFPGLFTCGIMCVKRETCLSFFYNKADQECFSVNSVLTSRDGCETRSGTSYYIRQAEVDCYRFTQAEWNQIHHSPVTKKGQCERYPFHVFTANENEEYKGCGTCSCCQVKGCITRVSRDYNGTWSQTKFGRPCQRWDSQSPHTHNQTNPSDFPLDTSVFDAHNYCRDPRNEDQTWCYTIDALVRWEYCDIPKC